VTQREPEPLPLDAYHDQAEVGPGVEPAVEELQLGRVVRNQKRGGQRSAETRAAGNSPLTIPQVVPRKPPASTPRLVPPTIVAFYVWPPQAIVTPSQPLGASLRENDE